MKIDTHNMCWIFNYPFCAVHEKSLIIWTGRRKKIGHINEQKSSLSSLQKEKEEHKTKRVRAFVIAQTVQCRQSVMTIRCRATEKLHLATFLQFAAICVEFVIFLLLFSSCLFFFLFFIRQEFMLQYVCTAMVRCAVVSIKYIWLGSMPTNQPKETNSRLHWLQHERNCGQRPQKQLHRKCMSKRSET